MARASADGWGEAAFKKRLAVALNLHDAAYDMVDHRNNCDDINVNRVALHAVSIAAMTLTRHEQPMFPTLGRLL